MVFIIAKGAAACFNLHSEWRSSIALRVFRALHVGKLRGTAGQGEVKVKGESSRAPQQEGSSNDDLQGGTSASPSLQATSNGHKPGLPVRVQGGIGLEGWLDGGVEAGRGGVEGGNGCWGILATKGQAQAGPPAGSEAAGALDAREIQRAAAHVVNVAAVQQIQAVGGDVGHGVVALHTGHLLASQVSGPKQHPAIGSNHHAAFAVAVFLAALAANASQPPQQQNQTLQSKAAALNWHMRKLNVISETLQWPTRVQMISNKLINRSQMPLGEFLIT